MAVKLLEFEKSNNDGNLLLKLIQFEKTGSIGTTLISLRDLMIRFQFRN